MYTRNLKLIITIMTIALFASCKSSGPENNNGNSQRGQGGQPSTEQLLKEMDANKDGKLSESEGKGPLKNDFSKIDTNGDGYITEKELENAPKPDRRGGGSQKSQGRN